MEGLGTEPSHDGSERAESQARVLARMFSGEAPSSPSVAQGRFEVLGRLGAGAMGEVLRARDKELGREVALKRLLRSSRSRSDRRERIVREARALAQVQHPNVVTLFEVLTEGEDLVLVMEYVQGKTLRGWLEEDHPVDEVIAVLTHAARGLAALHESDLVHRDVKPDNILVGEAGDVRVADLGLARIEDEVGKHVDTTDGRDENPSLTRTGALLGTPAYMAPEQLDGGSAGPRSDQFAWAVVLLEALSGQRLYEGATVEELRQAVAAGPGDALATAPRSLRPILSRALQLDPKARFSSMQDLVGALEQAQRPNRRLGWFAAGAVLVAAVAFAATRSSPQPSAATSAPACERSETAMNEVWGPDVEQRLRTRAQSELDPHDVEPWLRSMTRRLQARSGAWLDEQHRACIETRVEGSRTQADFDARIGCLQRQRATLEGLVGRVPAMDAPALQRLPRALSRLPGPRECDAADEADAAPPHPADALIRAASTEVLLGRYDEADDELRKATSALNSSGPDEYRALRARLVLQEAKVAEARGEHDAAEEAMLRAAELAEATRRDRLAARTWIRLVSVQATAKRDAERAAFYLSRARAAVSRLGDPPDLVAALAHKQGQQALIAGEHATARKDLQRARDLIEAAGSDTLVLAPVLMDLGRATYQEGSYGDAAAMFDEIAQMYEAEFGAVHPRVASALNNRGSSLIMADRLDEALAPLQRALEIRRERLGPKHTKVGQTLNAMAGVYLQRGELETALRLYREALDVQTEARGPDHPVLGATMANIGRTLGRMGKHDEAVAQLDEAVTLVRAAHGEDHPEIADLLHGRAAAKLGGGRAREAVDDYRRALAIRTRVFGEHAARTSETGVALAEALVRAGRRAEARTTIDRYLPRLREALGPDHSSVRQAEQTRATIVSGRG